MMQFAADAEHAIVRSAPAANGRVLEIVPGWPPSAFNSIPTSFASGKLVLLAMAYFVSGARDGIP